jgi:hypothetical protein
MAHNTTDGVDQQVSLPASGIKDLPGCSSCSHRLCLRQKVINLALGNTEIMYCLDCLGEKENNPPERLLAKIKDYTKARECFHKEWIKYKDVSYCPEPESCFPKTCFGK